MSTPHASHTRTAHQMQTEELSLRRFKDAIPKHCFERNLLVSLNYLLHDLLEVALWIAVHVALVDRYIYPFSTVLGVLCSAVCIAMQGTVMTGVWVIAHECGHCT